MPGARIGNNCSLGQNCFVGSRVRIGDGCRIQNNVSLYDGVTLDSHVFVGPSAVFTNVRRPRAAYATAPNDYAETFVGQGASIGANATIVCPVTIGQGAMVGAGAVVTRDVSAFSLVVGTPARISGWVCACGHALSNQPELTELQLICPACARTYICTALGSSGSILGLQTGSGNSNELGGNDD